MEEVKVVDRREVLGRELTVYGTADEPLFLAKDVAEWIGHSNLTVMVNSVDKDEKFVLDPTKQSLVGNFQSNTKYTFLTENGLYEVLMLSRKPIARAFKREVKRVLRSLRANGGYIVGQERLTPEQVVANALVVAQRIIDGKDRQIAEMRPKAGAYDAYLDRGQFCNFRDAAQMIGVPQAELMDLLKSKYVYRNDMGDYRCYAEYAEMFALRPFVQGGRTRQQLMLTISGVDRLGRALWAARERRREAEKERAMRAVDSILGCAKTE